VTARFFLVADISVGPLCLGNPVETVERLKAPATATAHVLIGVTWLFALAAKQPAVVFKEACATPLLTHQTNEQDYEHDAGDKKSCTPVTSWRFGSFPSTRVVKGA